MANEAVPEVIRRRSSLQKMWKPMKKMFKRQKHRMLPKEETFEDTLKQIDGHLARLDDLNCQWLKFQTPSLTCNEQHHANHFCTLNKAPLTPDIGLWSTERPRGPCSCTSCRTWPILVVVHATLQLERTSIRSSCSWRIFCCNS